MKPWTVPSLNTYSLSVKIPTEQGCADYRDATPADIAACYRAQDNETRSQIAYAINSELAERTEKAEARVRDLESAGAGLRLVLLERKLEEAEKRMRELEHYETEAKRKWEDRQQLRKEEDPFIPGAHWYTREVGGEEVISVHCMNAWKRKALAADDARSANATLREKLNAAETELEKVKADRDNAYRNGWDHSRSKVDALELEKGVLLKELTESKAARADLRGELENVKAELVRVKDERFDLWSCPVIGEGFRFQTCHFTVRRVPSKYGEIDVVMAECVTRLQQERDALHAERVRLTKEQSSLANELQFFRNFLKPGESESKLTIRNGPYELTADIVTMFKKWEQKVIR